MSTLFTGQLGTQLSELGNIIPGYVNSLAPLPFGFQAHVLNAYQIRVLYTTQVDDSALVPASYSLLAVSGPVPNYLPTVVSVEFYDADQYSVVLTMNQDMTYSTTYSMSIVNVTAQDGNEVTSSASNFTANVPSPPLPVGAFQTLRGYVDLIFNDPVGATSPGATAVLQGYDSSSVSTGSISLVLQAWNSSIPANNVRFQIPTFAWTANMFVISYTNVVDSSYNSGSGSIPFTLASQASLPYSFTGLIQAQIVDGWVDALSNASDGPNVAYLNIFFSCPMYGPDVLTASKWTVQVVTPTGNVTIPILGIENWSSTATAVFQTADSRTYYARLQVSNASPATSSFTNYIVKATLRSEDLAYTTNPANYTGMINIEPLNSPPRIVASSVDTNVATIRFDKGIGYPDSTTLSVQGPGGAVNTLSTSLSTSLQSLLLVVEDLMNTFTDHNRPPYGAVHVTPDTVNYFVPSDYPTSTLESTLTSLNRYRDVYYSHSQSTVYHNFADPNPVVLPYAVDIPSAVTLAIALIDSFVKHNANVGVHFSAGVPVFSANLLDTIVLGFAGMKAGASYTVNTSLQNVFVDAGEGTKTKKFPVSCGFIGQAVPPYVASALTQSGLTTSPTGVSFEQDSVTVWFSKPLQQVPVGTAPATHSGYITITGASGLNILGTVWTNDLVLNVGVSGMTASSYSLDVLDVADEFGNGIAEA